MQHAIALPQKINFKKGKKDNNTSVEIEPCYPGYGTTIGNALRRVLLSSLGGGAVVGVKIDGISHEFMAIEHIKEDVLEVLMNLKGIRMKIHSDEIVKLELDVHGKNKVTAKDIKKNSEVEIINNDLVLANITDMAGNLKMEIFVKNGIGYEPVEAREDRRNEAGYIEMDSIFSPVKKVSIKLENVRVGKMTNWEKLILDITTDGVISPEEAFKSANSILVDQFSSLTQEKASADNEESDEDDKSEKNVEEESKSAEEEKDEPKKKRGRPKKED